MSIRIPLAAILLACLAPAQTPPAPPAQDKVFDFTNQPSVQGLQELVTILRTVGDIRQLSIDSSARTLAIHGTPDELGLSAWILHALDQPAQSGKAGPAAPAQPYLAAGKSDDQIRIYHLAHTPTTQGAQEILTVLRTVADVQKIFNYSPLNDLVVRGPAARIALVEYLINALDVVPGSVTASPEFAYQPAGAPPQVVRVFYLASARTPMQIQELLTTLRVVADIQKIFNVTAVPALAIRGTPADLAASEWLIASLDIAPSARPLPGAAAREFSIPSAPPAGGLVRVFYPSNVNTAQLQQITMLLRTQVQVTKTFTCTSVPAIVVRGTGDQIAKSEQIILDKEQPARATP